MKQHITLEQLLELSIGQLAKLKKKLEADGIAFSNGEGMTWDEKQNICQYMTIGRMIEFLMERKAIAIYMETLIISGKTEKRIDYTVLCDALWKAYKQLLKEDNAKTNKD